VTAERIAIVTGSARGIGAATARRPATDEMAVAVLDLDEAACAGTVKEIADAGGRALAVGADVSDRAQVQAAVERVAEELGPPAVLVNNAGLQGFTKTVAIELGPFGITANAVAPGFIATDMTAATADRIGVSFDVFQKAAAERIPVRWVGHPDDVAHTISFLVSEGAGFVSGQVIYVAGGPLC